jgi:hypothetical protein
MKRLLIIVAALIIIVNVAVYAHVAYNRSGEPQIITLTENELALPYRYYRAKKENSGLKLSMEWRASDFDDSIYYWHSAHSLKLSEEKLAELGFQAPEDCVVTKSYRGGRDESRKAWIALEYDGPAYAKWSQQAEQALEKRFKKNSKGANAKRKKELVKEYENDLKRLKYYESHLILIDVALAKEDLLKQYADNQQVLIFAARIDNTSHCDKQNKVLGLSVWQLLPGDVNVPLQHREIFENLPGDSERGYQEPPRYEVDVAVGKLHEPWIMGVRRMESTPKQGF